MIGASPASPTTLPTVPPLVALALAPLPLLPLEAMLAVVLQRVCARHREMFGRLGSYAAKRFGIKPTDLPFAFVLEPLPPRPRLRVVRALGDGLDARISSPLAGLVGLVEGTLDGDALMFSRDLVVEGDVEAVLALRNAIDDAQVDLVGEAASLFGPFGGPLQRLAHALRTTRDSASGGAAQWN